MFIGGEDQFIEVLLVETTPQDLPGEGDLRLHVRVSFSTFCGEYDGVWVEASAFETFLSELHLLEEERRGSATRMSMSPDELLLRVHATDAAGHIGVTRQLGRWCGAGGASLSWCQIPFDLPLPCPSLLPQVLAEFRAMAASA